MLVVDKTSDSKDSEAVSIAAQTIGQRLDNRIAYARKEVERLCIAKAKAEALGILDYPHEFVETLVY